VTTLHIWLKRNRGGPSTKINLKNCFCLQIHRIWFIIILYIYKINI